MANLKYISCVFQLLLRYEGNPPNPNTLWTLEGTQLSSGLSCKLWLKKNDWGTFFHGGERLDFELPLNEGLPMELKLILYNRNISHVE